MSHPGNWSERKIALERAREAERRRREAESGDAELREVTIYAHHASSRSGGRRVNWFQLHPCATFRFCDFKVTARCVRCSQSWPIEAYMLDETPWAHRFWPAVLPQLFCPACGSTAAEVRFANEDGEVGALSIHPRVTLQVFKSYGSTKPEPSQGVIDAFAQHDDGALP